MKKQKYDTKKSETKEHEIEHPITLPQELHGLIIAQLADCWRPGRYLGKCALVSKKWLQEARRVFFLHRTVHVYEAAHDDKDPDKIFLDLLYQNEPICTFWPYLRDMRVCGYYDRCRGRNDHKAAEGYTRVLSMCLSRASNLQTLWVDTMVYSDLLKDAISNLAATKTVASIRIEDSLFPSPKELDLFLELFPQLRVLCQLEYNTLDCLEWDHSRSYVFSPPPSLQFSIHINVPEESALGLILHHQWNITNLRLDLEYPERMDFHLITNVLKHIGTPLKSFSVDLRDHCFQGPLPLSLSHNTSLESFHIWGLAGFESSDSILHLTWLAAVLNTIESREDFRDFKGYIWCDKNYSDTERLHQWLTSFDWASIEDVMLDFGRFPSEPKLTLALRGGLKWSMASSMASLKDGCMPRLAKAGRLMAAGGSEGRGIPIE